MGDVHFMTVRGSFDDLEYAFWEDDRETPDPLDAGLQDGTDGGKGTVQGDVFVLPLMCCGRILTGKMTASGRSYSGLCGL